MPRRFLRDRATVLFAAAVVLLIALSSWWFVFLQRAVTNEFQLKAELVSLNGRFIAQKLVSAKQLRVGPLAEDARFEVLTAQQSPAVAAAQSGQTELFEGKLLLARHVRGQWWLCTTKAHRERVVLRKQRLTWMLLGEGMLLSGLLLAVVAMLYRLFRSEVRFREEVQVFLRNVTHELKTPIAGIKAVLQTIQMGRVPDGQLEDLATRALREAEREEHLIDNLLTAQRLRQSDSALEVARLDVGELLGRLVDGRRALASVIDWQLTMDGNVFAVADASAVRTILDNLLDNAAKYGDGKIQVRAGMENDRVRIDVVDDGIGFDPEGAEELFVPFVRSSDSRVAVRAGTGLGLSISRRLVAEMKGKLEAHSSGEGTGARFSVLLPVWTDSRHGQ